MAVNLATSVGAAIALGLFAGKWLDGKFNTGNVYTIIGFALGVASAGKMLWDKLMEQDRQKSFSARKDNDKNND